MNYELDAHKIQGGDCCWLKRNAPDISLFGLPDLPAAPAGTRIVEGEFDTMTNAAVGQQIRVYGWETILLSVEHHLHLHLHHAPIPWRQGGSRARRDAGCGGYHFPLFVQGGLIFMEKR
jgi:hypothetical protein